MSRFARYSLFEYHLSLLSMSLSTPYRKNLKYYCEHFSQFTPDVKMIKASHIILPKQENLRWSGSPCLMCFAYLLASSLKEFGVSVIHILAIRVAFELQSKSGILGIKASLTKQENSAME
jgi:hypothetical protein